MAAPKIHLFAILALGFNLFSVYLTEDCTEVTDCTVTGCAFGGILVCDDDKKCTCKVDESCKDGQNVGVNCTRGGSTYCKNWYEGAADHNCECGLLNNIHCIDGECMCGYPPN